ncbi:NitT/TauT family transport system ATP-binding protein [Spinactinospora alkalitolerans]|uniref:NitT/TauT family transport system ATP-binding protein n=1 Tax=Spinactinospora alkalitolerans TaxID=687207 RepID=A0A852TUR9_9ACTN|nr:ABC transporter ATP-binding protein [Spinactinospora alkalitolerans]NYE47165.1 NitT/TauT family transport system ATP-binding protein [Spinactinospora alkalitolerans]
MTSRVGIKDLEITFTRSGEQPTTALSGLDLDIEAGTFLSIVGPSGCGKTTLLRAVAGLLELTGGSVTIDGDQVAGPRRETCVMFQSPTLLPWLNVLDNCLLPKKLRGRVQPVAEERATELLVRAGLKGFEKKYPYELSGGMQQRVALCRALGTDPSLLLLDEPFGALDAMTREQMNLDLHEMWARQSPTTVLITHSISEAVFLSQRVVVMSPRPGRVLEIIDVPLPDKREAPVMAEEAFARTCAHIRSYFTKGERNVDG